MTVNDATVEKLGELLNDNPRGLLVVRDELPGLLAKLEDEAFQIDRAFYLEAFNGDASFKYDRIGRGTVEIEMATLGFSNIADLFDDAGRLKPLDRLDLATTAAIQAIRVTTRHLGDGDVQQVVEIRLWDKLAALEKLARHFGLFSERMHKPDSAENPLTALIAELQRQEHLAP